MSNEGFKGISDLFDELQEQIKQVDNIQDVLVVGAESFVSDLLKLPKPMSKIRKSGYTHIISTFFYRKSNNEQVEVGWGKYYGPMLENGTKRMGARTHIRPTWDSNNEKYYSKMLNKLGY